MRPKLIKLSQIVEMTGTAESTLRLWISRGEFPAPSHKLPGAKGSRWRESDVIAWVEKQECRPTEQRAKVNRILRLESFRRQSA